jgi:hypothetical protein
MAGDENIGAVDFQFQRGEVLRGRLVDSGGSPLPLFWVYLEEEPDGIWTDREGRFEFRGLPAGTVRVHFSKSKFDPHHEIQGSFQWTLPGGEARIVLRRKAVISGRIVAVSGLPSYVEVTARPVDGQSGIPLSSWWCTMDGAPPPISFSAEPQTTRGGRSDGRFRLKVYPGRYHLEAGAPSPFSENEPSYLSSVPLVVELGEGEVLEGVELVFNTDGVIKGTILRWSNPVAGSHLLLPGPGGRQEVDADGEGRFEFPRLPAGNYLLSICTLSTANGAGARREVTVVQGEHREVHFDLRSVYVRGQVTRLGSPIPGAKIEVFPQGEAGDGFSTLSDNSGRYILELPAAGVYNFTVRIHPSRPFDVKTEIPEESRELQLDIELPRE